MRAEAATRLDESHVEVSYSAFTRFLACPAQEALLRMGVPRAAHTRRRNYLVGEVVHKMMERVLSVREVPDDGLVHMVFDRYSRRPGTHLKGPDDWVALRDKSIQAVRAFAPVGVAVAKKYRRTHAEQEVFADHPEEYGGRKAAFHTRMTSVLDLVGWDADLGEAVVVDWKTGKSDTFQIAWAAAVLADAQYPFPGARITWLLAHLDAEGQLKLMKVAPSQDEMDRARLEARKLSRSLYLRARRERLEFVVREATPSVYLCSGCRVRGACSQSVVRDVGRGRTGGATR